MRRSTKPTLYELMHTDSMRSDDRVVGIEAAPRALRVPKGFLYIGVMVLVLLLMGSYWLGVLRGEAAVQAAWDRDRADALAVERQMRTVLEVDEPGGATREPVQVVPAEPAPASPRPAAVQRGEIRVAGMNYYIIDHPSREKVDELVSFCRSHGLDAYQTLSSNGSPKVFVLPGYPPGGSSSRAMDELRAQIRTVGVLWERVDPKRNSDFSTRFAEKYRVSTPSG